MHNFIKSIVLLVIVLKHSVVFGQDETTIVHISDPVPQFQFEEAPGQSESISEYRGKTILITFFATWCGPCRKELPHIQKEIYDKYKSNPNFVLLIFGREHTWEEVNKFKADNNFTMPFFPDTGRKIYSKFASQYIPRNFLISGDGKIIFQSIGFEDKDFKTLKSTIDSELKK
jgi:thiol-disulfide isomerase/thioredoxin